MVRLKVNPNSTLFLSISAFQFLMVRLKERSKVVIYKVNSDISIPYGAIKSFFAIFFVIFVKFISIPYGAIKRFNFGGLYSIITKFQFLMVRLKGNSTPLHKNLICHFNSLWCD